MEIACMTSSFYSCRDRETKISFNESISRLKAAGFDHVDLCLLSIGNPVNQFFGEDWEKKAYALREDAQKLGVTFIQSHMPYNPKRSFKAYSEEETAHFREVLMRGQRIAEICGVPNVVIHPLTEVNAPLEDMGAHVHYNYEFYDAFLTACDRAGMCACFENLPLGYGQYATQMLGLMYDKHSHNTAVCWDFGHGQLNYPKRTWSDADQTAAIGMLKGHIRAVHVHDNLGKEDNHLLPFLGVIEWEKVLPALRESGFTGDLVFEIKQNAAMPDELMDDSIGFCAKVGRKLIELFECGA